MEQLPHVLWSYRTTPSLICRRDCYNLVYGSKAFIPIEFKVTSRRVENQDDQANEKELRTMLDLLEKRKNYASIREARYKEAMVKHYNLRIRNTQFRVGDLVLRNNKANRVDKTGKLEA